MEQKLDSNSIDQEINKRRTFAIISHPDAGKTTITEKLLLYGGAIREAGSVKSKKSNTYAVSDWMEIEKQRGISVTSSVLQFNYNGFCINILDTPGHKDFSEDTYRTLMAADSAVMVIDSAKGVEAQTRKLFEVAALRKIPIFTVANKMDRNCLPPFDLMDDIENSLGIKSFPMNWPIGSGKNFKGVYNRFTKNLELFNGREHGNNKADVNTIPLDSTDIHNYLTNEEIKKLNYELELLDEAGEEYSEELINKGELTPMFFASALTNFGIENFLNFFLKLTPSPLPRESNEGLINPTSNSFSGFIFKIQANMNPAHRDRIAFLRICSGQFKKGMQANHSRIDKKIRLSQPQQFMAKDRVIVEEAYAGDIIGIQDPGIFRIGDTLYDGNKKIVYKGIPVFSPEIFAKVWIKNSLKRKQFIKGINQLSEEGSIQVFKRPNIGTEELIVGVVGALQLEILDFRLKNEYGADVIIDIQPYKYIRWIEKGYDPSSFMITMDTLLVNDKEQNNVLLFQNEWSINQIKDRNKNLVLNQISYSNQ